LEAGLSVKLIPPAEFGGRDGSDIRKWGEAWYHKSAPTPPHAQTFLINNINIVRVNKPKNKNTVYLLVLGPFHCKFNKLISKYIRP